MTILERNRMTFLPLSSSYVLSRNNTSKSPNLNKCLFSHPKTPELLSHFQYLPKNMKILESSLYLDKNHPIPLWQVCFMANSETSDLQVLRFPNMGQGECHRNLNVLRKRVAPLWWRFHLLPWEKTHILYKERKNKYITLRNDAHPV